MSTTKKTELQNTLAIDVQTRAGCMSDMFV